MEINIDDISKEIQNILAKNHVTIDLIEEVLSKSCELIKLRTQINAID